MSDFDEVLELLLTDPGFAARLGSDPAGTLAGYQLSADEVAVLSSQVSQDRGGQRQVEQRVSKSSLFGLLSSLPTGIGQPGEAGIGRPVGDAGFGQPAAQGVDVVLENVVSNTFGESLRSTAQNAVVVVLGNIAATRVEIDPGLVIARRIRIAGSGNATYKDVRIALHLLASSRRHPAC